MNQTGFLLFLLLTTVNVYSVRLSVLLADQRDYWLQWTWLLPGYLQWHYWLQWTFGSFSARHQSGFIAWAFWMRFVFCTTTLNSSGVSYLIQNWLYWLQWTYRLINPLSTIHSPLLSYCGSISTDYSECSADYSERCSHLNVLNCQARNNNVMNLTKTHGVT